VKMVAGATAAAQMIMRVPSEPLPPREVRASF